MTKVYKKYGAILVGIPSKDLVYLNMDDIRLYISGEVFMINEGQTNRTYELGDHSKITDELGLTTYATKELAWEYLMGIMDPSSLSIPSGTVSVANSSSMALEINGTFVGTWVATLDYSEVIVSVHADEPSAVNGLKIEWSSNGVNIHGDDKYTISANSGKTFSFPCQNRYVRVSYQNDGVATTSFNLETLLKRYASKGSSHKLADSLNSQDDSIVTKSMLAGFYEADGSIKNVGTSKLGNLKVALAEYQGDAFGRLRVSEPYTLFDNSLTSPDSDAIFWSAKTNGTASNTYDRLTSKHTLSVTGIGSYNIRQTKQRFKYQPGKSHMILITGLLNTEIGFRKRTGYVDYDNIALGAVTNAPQNGVFFQNNDGVLSWNIVNNGVITETALQSAWNIDKADGNGASGFTLNINSTNIFFMDLEWLGVGAVRCGFVNGSGEIIACHQFKHASMAFTDVYMRTANLPVSYEITSTSGVGTGTMKQICSSVISEGGFNPQGLYRSVYTATPQQVTNATSELLLGLRLKTDNFEYAIIIDSVSLLTTTTGDSRWTLVFNPTYVGTPTWANLTNSSLQVCDSPNFVVTEANMGIVIASGFYSASINTTSQNIASALRLGKNLLGVLDEVWLVITPLSGQNESYLGSISIRELI